MVSVKAEIGDQVKRGQTLGPDVSILKIYAMELYQRISELLLEAADDPANPDWRVISARGTVLAKQRLTIGLVGDEIPAVGDRRDGARRAHDGGARARDRGVAVAEKPGLHHGRGLQVAARRALDLERAGGGPQPEQGPCLLGVGAGMDARRDGERHQAGGRAVAFLEQVAGRRVAGPGGGQTGQGAFVHRGATEGPSGVDDHQPGGQAGVAVLVVEEPGLQAGHGLGHAVPGGH